MSNMEFWSNNSLMDSLHDVSMGQVFNGDEESRNYNPVVGGDNGTGIRIRSRPARNDPSNMNPAIQGTAPRRIRLQRKIQVHPVQPIFSNEAVKYEGCAPEDHDSKPTIAGVRN